MLAIIKKARGSQSECYQPCKHTLVQVQTPLLKSSEKFKQQCTFKIELLKHLHKVEFGHGTQRDIHYKHAAILKLINTF